ncbi:MAG: hypothetical protein AAFW74_08920 [Pseudomonadota bacterium]
MQAYYAKGGFDFSHRDIRYQAEFADGVEKRVSGNDHIVPIDKVPFEVLAAYDRTCFPAPRPEFLAAWTNQPAALALGCMREGKLCGYGVIRRCLAGCKVGPLFADDAQAAQALYSHLAPFADGTPVFLDVPENNPNATELARRYGMQEVFGCARMYLGAFPDIAHNRIFGVTTFELG